MNAWDWSNVPWEPFCIVGLIFVCLGILGYSLQQQETIDRLKRENATLNYKLNKAEEHTLRRRSLDNVISKD